MLGTAVRFILSNGALVYKPSPSEIRILFLDGSADEEIHIDPGRLVVQAIPQLRALLSSLSVDPLHYSDGVVSFLVEAVEQKHLIFCNVKQRNIIGTHQVEWTNSIFVRNNGEYLYYGFQKHYPGDRWLWVIGGYNLLTHAWISDHRLPAGFSGTELGLNVCFEIIDGYLYGVSSSAGSPRLEVLNEQGPWEDSFYRVFRMELGDSSRSPRQDLPKKFSWRRPWRSGCVDLRYNDLKLIKDEDTGVLWIYEVRKEWSLSGHTERNCYRKAISTIHFSTADDRFLTSSFDAAPVEIPSSEMFDEILRGENAHIGENGIDLGQGDPGRVYAHTYHTATRSFVDIIGTRSASDPDREWLRLRVRPMTRYMDDSFGGWNLHGYSPAGTHQARFWPPEPTPGRWDPTLDLIHALMNPQKGPVEKIRWAADERLFVFSPVGRGRHQPRALILVSFDPGLRLHGLRKVDGTPERPVPQSLEHMSSHLHPDDGGWASNVQPFHLVIKSHDGPRYGFDFTAY